MTFQSNEGNSSGVCRVCNELPDAHGICNCGKIWGEHPNHETTSKDYCGACKIEKLNDSMHFDGFHLRFPAPGCPHCETE